jgi:prepilin-type N-terminal cleavage/methylation domain-containing protein
MSQKGFSLIELLVVIVIIGILAAIALPNYIKAKDKAKEAEVKANLHAIQIAIERYAVDAGGNIYPPYLIGGDTPGWMAWHDYYDTGVTVQVAESPGGQPLYPDFVRDPLIEYCYLYSYPDNPFVDDNQVIINGTLDSAYSAAAGVNRGDPRFGLNGNVMGQGLDDPMFFGISGYLENPRVKLMDFSLTLPDAYDLGFPTWDTDPIGVHYMMGGRRPNVDGGEPLMAWWPGNFYYRAGWATTKRYDGCGMGIPGHPAYRTGPFTYILGAYGSYRGWGMDVIRLEGTYSNGAEMFYRMPSPWNIDAAIHGGTTVRVGVYKSGSAWDPGKSEWGQGFGIPECYGGYWYTYFDDPENYGTNPAPSWPYYNWNTSNSGRVWAYGCPDGVKDGVILVLTPEGALKPDSMGWEVTF